VSCGRPVTRTRIRISPRNAGAMSSSRSALPVVSLLLLVKRPLYVKTSAPLLKRVHTIRTIPAVSPDVHVHRTPITLGQEKNKPPALAPLGA